MAVALHSKERQSPSVNEARLRVASVGMDDNLAQQQTLIRCMRRLVCDSQSLNLLSNRHIQRSRELINSRRASFK